MLAKAVAFVTAGQFTFTRRKEKGNSDITMKE